MIDIEKLRSRISYCPETGSLTWLPRSPESFDDGKYSRERLAAIFNSAHAGKSALSCQHGTGYLSGMFDGVQVKAHRAAWAIFYGSWPTHIDHIDGDRSNNRISNLRDVGPVENARNRSMHRLNSSGRTGVTEVRRGKILRWYATIGGGPRRKHLGSFRTFDEACAARSAAEVALEYHPNHGRLK